MRGSLKLFLLGDYCDLHQALPSRNDLVYGIHLTPAMVLTICRPIEAVSRLVNLGLRNATKSVIARHLRGIAPGIPDRQIRRH